MMILTWLNDILLLKIWTTLNYLTIFNHQAHSSLTCSINHTSYLPVISISSLHSSLKRHAWAYTIKTTIMTMVRNLKLSCLLVLFVHVAQAQLSIYSFEPLEEKITRTMDSLQIPGLQIAITKGDSVIFIKGFGIANLTNRSPVDPFKSKFHIGSITKVFTAICVQQAANAGKLDLDSDIHDYLDFEINRPYEGKISLNHLLSHSAGLDELWYNGGEQYESIESVGLALRSIPIKQIRPAGETFSYSNLSVNLAGYILAKRTQKPVYQHYNDVICGPLGLTDTGVFLDRYDPDYPASYYLIDDELLESPHDRTNLYTSGNIYSTASDMSRLMRALLNEGSLDSSFTLGTDFLSQIGTTRFEYEEHDQYASGLGIFITKTHKGTVYSHLGFVQGFASQMYLFENEKIGIFMSANNQKGIQGLQEIFLSFMKLYLPHYKSQRIVKAADGYSHEEFTGNYIPTRTSLSGIGKLESLLTSQLSFQVADDGSPQLTSGDRSIRLVPQESFTYVDTTKFIHKTISFLKGEDRLIMNYAVDKGIYGIWPFMKLKWYEERGIQYPFRIISLLVFVFFPITWLFQFISNRNKPSISIKKVLFSFAMLSTALGFIVFVVSSMNYERMRMLALESLPWQINFFATLNILGVLFTILVLIRVWFSSQEKRYRVDYFLLLLLILTGLNNYLYNSFSIISF